MRQIILDTETTGLETSQGHRVIEIGAVEMINRRYTGNNFHRYLNPEREIDEAAIEVHGITNERLRDEPLFDEVAVEFLGYLKDAELIIHNAPFDVGFLNNEFKIVGYGDDVIERVKQAVAKKAIKRNPDTQLLEDVTDLVFIEHYMLEFAGKHPEYSEEKWLDIIRKTWDKMSDQAHEFALSGGIKLPEPLVPLIQKAVAGN